MIAADPWHGGATWAVLQYLLGFRQLGHHVHFVEPIPPKAIRPSGVRFTDSENAAYFQKVMGDFKLSRNSTLLLTGTTETLGVGYGELQTITRSADVLVNISGMLADEALTSNIPVRAYLDLDPAFNQLWHAVQRIDMRFVGHTHFLTIGQAIGEAGCKVPNCGLKWLKTLQPVVLDHWPISTFIKRPALTTIANWRGYGSIQYEGEHYGQKAHSLRQFIDLPTRTDEQFLLALAIHPAETNDLAALAANRWHLVDPAQVAGCPATYQKFIQESKAEFGISKSGYVVSQCGWFSDRSACYLASGKPVIAQETGFSRHLPCGTGLLAFQNSEEALYAIQQLKLDYLVHARRAREIAVEFFDSKKVLSRLLEKIRV